MIQEQLAAILNMAKSTVSQYENNINEPDLKTLIKLADIFEVSTDYLLGRSTVRRIEAVETVKPKNVAYLGEKEEKLSDNEAEYLKESLSVYRKVRDK
jgi:transcriptional regulator with XRE-family HTH domain